MQDHQGTPTSLGSQDNKDGKEAPANLPLAMDQLLVLNTGLQRRNLGDNFDQRLKVTQSHFVTTADNRFLFACGFWDKSFRLYLADTAKILQVVYGHYDVVTVITRSECNLNQDCYVVTGSKDCTVMVWMFTSRNQAIIGDNGSIEQPTPKATLTGHRSEVTCVSVLAELGMVISGSLDGPCLLHTLSGDLLRSLEPTGTNQMTANLISMSRETFVMIKFDAGDICNFSINGRLQKHCKHKDNVQAMSRDGQYLMLGGDSGVVEVWRSHDLTLLYTYPPCDSCICSLALSHDQKFLLAGLATGCLLVFNIDFYDQGTPTSLGSQDNKDGKEAPANLPLAMDQLLVLNTGIQRRNLGDNFDQRLKVTQSHFVTTADNRFLFACGFWDKSFRLYLADTAKILQVVYGHYDVVTVITRSECNLNQDCYVVTGSKDCTVMVWMFTSRNQAIIGDKGSIEQPTPKATLTGHRSEVTCVSVLAELGMVISGSLDGPCLLHTLSGDLLRSLEPPGTNQMTANLISMSRETFVRIKFDAGDICNFSINGRLQKHFKHKDNVQAMSRDGQYLMLGGDSGVVEVWRSHDLTLLYTYPPCDSCICSLALSHDQKFLLAGLATGCLLVFNIDFNKWHHEYQEKY